MNEKVSAKKQAKGFIDTMLSMGGARAAVWTKNVAKLSQSITHLIKAAAKK
ncbi:hypothetical protein HOO54_13620 [Bacillus sp. WMMC1349]|uniref:hypothetical protein n=1 Tax=Bacillus sp. WMMC1349 TaxID=2736254 RepID=UPI00155206E8|nr:hypothetical protein [Bacillus sp. WMMC1349]NPC93243.1 hypothetical protein [Bacillus sp. WMMC1349]